MRITFNRIVLAIAGMMLAATAGQVQAGFLGQSVGYQYYFADASTVYYDGGNLLVGGGVETGLFSPTPDFAGIDISDTNIAVDFLVTGGFTSSSFNGIRIFDSLSTLSTITSVSVNAVTNMFGFTAANVSFDGDNVWVNWQGLSFDLDTIVSLDVSFDAVPEPASLAMWGLGALGMMVAVRRRRQSKLTA